MTESRERILILSLKDDVSDAFHDALNDERAYQFQQWGDNENVHTWPEWAAILGDEYGEVCKAIKYVHWQGERADAPGRHGLRGELVQLATVCMAMVEQIDEGEVTT